MLTNNNSSITVEQLLKNKELGLKLIAGKKSLANEITFSKIQKPGLALAGFTNYIKKGRVQVIGLSEIDFLNQYKEKKQIEIFKKFLKASPTCIILANNIKIPSYLIDLIDKSSIALLSSHYPTSTLIEKVTNYLSEVLAPTTIIHGDLLDIFGIGTLIIGESGVGKSESALDLIVRGHRLIADDAVVIKKISETVLIGQSCPDIKNFIEVRGIGIINICDIFGISSISNSVKIELVILLERFNQEKEYERLGLNYKKYNILGVDIPFMMIPIAPGRNIAMLIEVAVCNLLLKYKGASSTKNLLRKINKKISEKQ